MTTLWDPDLYNRALWFAGRVHGEQKIPGQPIPYLLHLAQVCQESLGAVAADPSLDGNLTMQCAILHDAIEDTDCTYEEVLDVFGQQVADGVDALSKRKIVDGEAVGKPEQMADSLTRIRAQGREVWVVKLADRITNLQQPPAYWTTEKTRGYHAEAERILEALGPASLHLTARMEAKLAAYQRHF